jgi:hypothetical protein
MWVLIVVLVVVVLLVVFVVSAYNGLVKSKNQVESAWAQIDVQLKRRHDLIPNWSRRSRATQRTRRRRSRGSSTHATRR